MVEILDLQSMLGVKSEPKRKFRWILNIENIDVFMLMSAARPKVTFAQALVPYQNITRKYSGKPTWEDLPVTLVDYISPSSAQRVWEKMRLNHDPVTGTMGYPEFYQEEMTLKLLGPVGDVVEQWRLVSAWFGDIDGQDLSYEEQEGVVNISFTVIYDWAILEF